MYKKHYIDASDGPHMTIHVHEAQCTYFDLMEVSDVWGMRQGGERAHIRVVYTDRFLKETYPTTAKGAAMVQKGSGIKVNHFYYRHGF